MVEGNAPKAARGGETDVVVQARRKLLKGMRELVVVGSALVLLEGLLGHKKCQKLALAYLDRGEILNGVSVPPGIGLGIVFHRQVELVPHEGQVPHNGLRRNLELRRE